MPVAYEDSTKRGHTVQRTQRSIELFATAVQAALLYISLEQGRDDHRQAEP